MKASQEQIEAIRHWQGPCMVLAGPGSGKTFTITRRIAYLIQEKGVAPEAILVVTFTRAAAEEMQSRLVRLMGKEGTGVTFGTFHSIYYRMISQAYGLRRENILSGKDRYRGLLEVVRKEDLEEFQQAEDIGEFLSTILQEISYVKNSGSNPRKFFSAVVEGESFARLYYSYDSWKRRKKKVDFDDMLFLCLSLFQNRADILQKWQERYLYILVDEFQDINPVQYAVLRLLAKAEKNLFVVGDDDQSIYGFRGASPQLMLQFPVDYSGAKQVTLRQNFRSARRIVKGALQVVEHNRCRYRKKLQAAKDSEGFLEMWQTEDACEESKVLVEAIQRRHQEGISYGEMAVLYRVGVQARMLPKALEQAQIPYWEKERIPSLYEHFAVKDLLAYLRIAAGGRARRDFLAVMNRPLRYLERASMPGSQVDFQELRQYYCDKKWMQKRIEQWQEDMECLGGLAPYTAVQYVRRAMGYDAFIREYAREHGMKAEEIFQTMEEMQEQTKEFATIEAYLTAVLEQKEEETLQRSTQEQKNGVVTLQTMHGAKGLEYDTVYILQANEGSMPYYKAITAGEVEEERRLFYVAMTRAKERLVIFSIKKQGGKKLLPSRFLKELTEKDRTV